MNIHQVNFKRYKEKAIFLLKNNNRVQALLNNSKSKLKFIIDNNQNLKEFTEKVSLMIRMLKAQFNGEYADFPWKTVTMIAGSLIYFITPLDFMPDFIPVLGIIDDATVIYWIYQIIQEDIDKFKLWENTIKIVE